MSDRGLFGDLETCHKRREVMGDGTTECRYKLGINKIMIKVKNNVCLQRF